MTATGGAAARGADHVALAVLALAAGAWFLLWAQALGGHGHVHGDARAWGSGALALAAGWLLMVIAMMLPLAIGLLAVVRRLVRRRPRPGLLVAVAAAGFLVPWALTGQAALAAHAGLGALAGRLGIEGAGVLAVAGGVVAGAGAYQLSPLKHRSLATCRSPAGIAMRRWRGVRPALEAARIGAAYGASCVACCWALMALMLLASAGGLLVMAPLAALMAIERATPWGPAAARGAGAGLIGLGALLAAAAVLAG